MYRCLLVAVAEPETLEIRLEGKVVIPEGSSISVLKAATSKNGPQAGRRITFKRILERPAIQLQVCTPLLPVPGNGGQKVSRFFFRQVPQENADRVDQVVGVAVQDSLRDRGAYHCNISSVVSLAVSRKYVM